MMKMSMEHRWNVTDTEKPKYSKKNRSNCHFVHKKAYYDHLDISAAWTLKGIYFIHKCLVAVS